jgi:hypothetical protein
MDNLQGVFRMDKLSPSLDLSGMWMVGCGSKDGWPTRRVLKRDWIMCSKYSNPYRLNSQQNWGTYMTT